MAFDKQNGGLANKNAHPCGCMKGMPQNSGKWQGTPGAKNMSAGKTWCGTSVSHHGKLK
jgi:hypothetical protein